AHAEAVGRAKFHACIAAILACPCLSQQFRQSERDDPFSEERRICRRPLVARPSLPALQQPLADHRDVRAPSLAAFEPRPAVFVHVASSVMGPASETRRDCPHMQRDISVVTPLAQLLTTGYPRYRSFLQRLMPPLPAALW